MSHRTEERLGVVKSVSGIAGVTLTVIVLITCAAKLRTNSLTPSNEQTVVSTEESEPTKVVWNVPSNAGIVARDVASKPTDDAADISAADGFIAADATLSPFDVEQPAVGNLNGNLLEAIQEAATDAANEAINIRINSGWRSARYQQQLLDQAVVKYGSEQEALKWVDTPEQSAHVAGNAVDVAPTAADYWLKQHGSSYGLCQIYANEIWHFELAVEPGTHCPRPKADASDG